jgi:hypothetical protein
MEPGIHFPTVLCAPKELGVRPALRIAIEPAPMVPEIRRAVLSAALRIAAAVGRPRNDDEAATQEVGQADAQRVANAE